MMRTFLDQLPVSAADKERIAQVNAQVKLKGCCGCDAHNSSKPRLGRCAQRVRFGTFALACFQ